MHTIHHENPTTVVPRDLTTSRLVDDRSDYREQMAPTPYTVTRSTEISARADAVYPLLVDLHRWTEWSPWEGTDPDMARTYEGAESGVGATYRWKGNRKAGSGSMTITDVDRPGHVTIDLEFEKPFKASNVVLLTLSEDEPAGTTVVEWTMTGRSAGLGKLFAFFMPMDKLVGGDFERGLRQLKARVESAGTV